MKETEVSMSAGEFLRWLDKHGEVGCAYELVQPAVGRMTVREKTERVIERGGKE